MVKPIQNYEDGNEEEDEEENFVCPHLGQCSSTESSSRPSQQPQPSGSSSSLDNGNGNGVSGAEIAGTVLKTAGIGGVSAVGGTTLATAGLTAAGFSSGGIVGGSIAAGIQASIGNVVAGSAFATAQSIGATGGFALLGPVGIACGILGGGIYAGVKLVSYLSNKKDNQKNEMKPVFTVAQKTPDEDKAAEKQKRKSEPLIKGVNICEECWLKLQILKYNRLSKSKKPSDPK